MPEANDGGLDFGRSSGDEEIQSMGLSSRGQFLIGSMTTGVYRSGRSFNLLSWSPLLWPRISPDKRRSRKVAQLSAEQKSQFPKTGLHRTWCEAVSNPSCSYISVNKPIRHMYTFGQLI